MKILKFFPIILMLVIGYTADVSAQKFGHLNANDLLSSMPQTKTANSQLESFSKQKQKEVEAKGKALSDFYVNTMKKIKGGELSPMQQQQAEVDLQRKQQELQKFEYDAQEAIMKKQSDLFQPIVDKVNAAIKKVGQDNGYAYIFDSGLGALVHFEDSEDVTPLVKKELGL
jgi:outer membrane protein